MQQYISKFYNANLEELKNKSLLEKILYIRGFKDPQSIHDFLNPSLENLHSPFLFRDMKQAVQLVKDAINQKHKIVIFGDYDCDGICASTIIFHTIKKLNGDVTCYVPSRKEGYGLNKSAVLELSKQYQLMITVDLGITNTEEIDFAKSLGMHVIISDHHQLPERLPNADAILHPAIPPYPFSSLSGGGVAFKFSLALLNQDRYEFIDFATISLIGDLVPLVGENRTIVKFGLQQLFKTQNIGLKTLLYHIFTNEKELTSSDVAYQVVPRINAAGRIDDAKNALMLFQSQSKLEADEWCALLENLNNERKHLSAQIYHLALNQISTIDFSTTKFLVAYGEDWNHGVIGLVAGKLCEKFKLPVAVFTIDGNMATASLRSIPGINIYYFLKKCEDLFVKWGGHEQAAGLTLNKDNILKFARRMNENIGEEIEESVFVPKIEYDLEIDFSEISLNTIEDLKHIEPCGIGNPSVRFFASEVELLQSRQVGANLGHLKLLCLKNNVKLDAISFNNGNLINQLSDRINCVFSVELNTYMGTTKAQLNITALSNTLDSQLKALNNFSTEILEREKIHFLAHTIEKYKKFTPIKSTESFYSPHLYGNLFLSYNKDVAMAFYKQNSHFCDLEFQNVNSISNQSTLVFSPVIHKLPSGFKNIIVLDGIYSQEQVQELQLKFPNSKIYVQNFETLSFNDMFNLTDYRKIFMLISNKKIKTLSEASESCQTSLLKVIYAFEVFKNLNLIQYDYNTLNYTICPNLARCNIEDSTLISALK